MLACLTGVVALQGARQRSAPLDHGRFKVQPVGPGAEFAVKRRDDRPRISPGFDMRCSHQQPAVRAIRFEVNARNNPLVEKEGQDIVAPFALRLRRVDLDSVVEIEQAFGSWSKPDERVEWRKEGCCGCAPRRFGFDMEIGQVSPVLHFDAAQPACFNKFVEASPAVLWRHPIIIREIGGSGDAVGSACAVEEFTLSVLPRDNAGEVILGDDALRQIVEAREIRSPVGDREKSTSEMRFQDGSCDGAVPRAGHTWRDPIGVGKVLGCSCPPRFNLCENTCHVMRIFVQESIESMGSNAVCLAAVTQQRPEVHWDDGCFVCPLLRELPILVHELVEKRPVVGAESREEDLEVRRDEYVDVVELKKTEPVDGPADIRGRDAAIRSWAIESLSAKRDAAGFCEAMPGMLPAACGRIELINSVEDGT